MRFPDSILHNFWPKLLSLVLAVATWFYVFDLVNSDSLRRETVADILSRTNFIVKEVTVNPVFTGETPEGYRVDLEAVKINPATVSIFGPEVIVDKVTELRTDRVDLSEYTRSVSLRLGVHTSVQSLELDDKFVELFLPVLPVKPEKTFVKEAAPPKEEQSAKTSEVKSPKADVI